MYLPDTYLFFVPPFHGLSSDVEHADFFPADFIRRAPNLSLQRT